MVEKRGREVDAETTEYEKDRAARVLRNEKMVEALNLRGLAQEVNSSQAQKRKKKATDHNRVEGSEAAIGRTLRSSSRVCASHVDLQDGVTNPEQQQNEVLQEPEKKRVRGRTRKADIFARQNKPKLQVEINERGQPCGLSGTEFANFIGALVRTKGFPIAFNDWRKVCPRRKYKLWTDAKLYWDVDQSVFNWFMKTAATKWKEFKSDLKTEFESVYHEDMEDDELMALCDVRVHEHDWKWLIDHWRSPEAIARSLRAKANRAKLTQNHTSGSKSHARVDSEMREELGRAPRRDELFVKTHTHKTGEPHKGAETTINALKEAVRDHPELIEKSIQEGDVYFHVCGPEKNGYVRVIGLGPTPAELEMPGAKKYTSTRLQMEIEARRQADKKVEDLESRVNLMQQQMDKLIQQCQNANKTPIGSNNERQNSRCRLIQADDEVDGHEDDAGSYAGDHMEEEHLSDYEDMFMNRRVVCSEGQHEKDGRDVILYNVVRPYEAPVAKATVQSTNPNAIVGGTRLGVQYYEVVVNHVFMRDAILPRPYGKVTSVGEARGRSIAWPCDRMKDDKKSPRQSKVPGFGARPSQH